MQKPALWKQDSGKLKVCIPFLTEKRPTDFEPDDGELLVSLERFSKEEQEALARDKLKSATEASSLSKKKIILQHLAKMYPGTKAAKAAEKQLKRMPSDDEIRKIQEKAEAARKGEVLEAKATQMLRIAKMLQSRNPQAARRRLKEIADNYGGTKAAVEAKALLKEL